MTTTSNRGGAGRCQGRKALAGEVRKVRPFKATDAEWEDFKLVTPERVRQWVAKEAAKLRKAEKPNASFSRGPSGPSAGSDSYKCCGKQEKGAKNGRYGRHV